MKFMNSGWPVMGIAVWLSVGSLLWAGEPSAPEKNRGAAASTTPDPTAHGLLANRFSTSAVSGSPLPANGSAAKLPAGNGAAATDEQLPNSFDLRSTPPASSIGLATYAAPQQADLMGTNDLTALSPYDPHNGSGCDCCSDPLWCYRNSVFVDFLYLRPGNIDYIYAVEQTGTLPTDSPTGPVGRVGFDGAAWLPLGIQLRLSDCSGIQISYTWFQNETNNTINATPGTVLLFQPGLPSVPNVGAGSIQASARDEIRFQLLDADYRGLLWGTCNSAVNYFAGLRYANLNQRFHAQENVGVPVGLTDVRTEINFDGFGIGGGLDGIRRSDCTGLLIYGRASASFVAGEFKADYRQTAQFLPAAALGNTLVDYRVLTILQAELGTGWQSASGATRITLGYMFAGWFNSLTNGSYIPGVQTRQFNNLNETITFDGLVSRFEWRF